MSKTTNDGLTRSGTGCFIAVPKMAAVGVKGLLHDTYVLVLLSDVNESIDKCRSKLTTVLNASLTHCVE